MGRAATAALVMLGLLTVTSPARAMRCSEWEPVPPDGQAEALQTLIRDEINAPDKEKYQVNRAALERCLVRLIPEMRGDFDYACSQGQKVPLDVLDQIFRRYLSRCI